MAGPSFKDQLDDLLGKLNPGGVIGLDIGAHSIKVCEVSGSPGKVKVDKFAIIPLSEAAIIEDEIQKPAEITAAIISAFKQANIRSKMVCIGLYGPNTMTKRLNTPEGSKEEIEDHVMWEAEQYITFGADESMIDFHIIGDNDGGGKDTLVAAAKVDVVDHFTEVVKPAKLNVKVVDLSVIALSNIFEEFAGSNLEEYDAGTLLIDFGAQSTKIVIYKKGGPIFTKEISVGGALVTEEIQRQMGVSYQEAEDLKTSGELPEEILAVINTQVDQQVAEIRKNINFYVTQGSAEKVNYCFITGGSSLLPGLVEKLSIAAGMPVERLEIFNVIKVDERKIGINLDHLTAISPVVVGLAMRKFN